MIVTIFLFRRAWVNFPLSSCLCVSHTTLGQSAALCSGARVEHHAPAEVLSRLLFPPLKKCDSSQCLLLWNPADLSGASLSAEPACSWPQSLPCVRSSSVRVLYKLDPVYTFAGPVLCYVLKQKTNKKTTWTTCNCFLALRCILLQLYPRVHISKLCVCVCVCEHFINFFRVKVHQPRAVYFINLNARAPTPLPLNVNCGRLADVTQCA